jgi:hypothetical protein
MIRTRIRKLSNPRRVKVKRRNNVKRRKISPKQIRIFGTKRQKAALKAANRRKRNPISRRRRRNESVEQGFWRSGKFHPIRSSSDYDPEAVGERFQYKRAPVKRRTKRRNPALIITLGATNPRRRHTVAKAKNTRRRRRSNEPNRRRARRQNPKHIYVRRRQRNATVARRRRHNPKVIVRYRARNRRRHNVKRYARHHNPSLFGASITSKEGMKILGGGLVGVAAAKFIPTLLPTSVLGSLATSNIGKTVLTAGSAVAAGWLAGKWDHGFGNGVLFGGLMQTASVALNAFLPSVYQQLGISLGDLLPGQFAVPQNPIRQGIAPPAPVAPAGSQSRVTMSGLSRGYGYAY